MKIPLILAHPDKNSFDSAIAKCCLEALVVRLKKYAFNL